MCMSQNEINTVVKDLQELRRMKEELEGEISGLEDRLKAHMLEKNQFEVDALTGHVTWLEQTSKRFSQSEFKKELPDLYNRYCRDNTTRYFRILK